MTYTTNGADPTLSDPVILSGNPISVTTPTTLKARTFLTGMPDRQRRVEGRVLGSC